MGRLCQSCGIPLKKGKHGPYFRPKIIGWGYSFAFLKDKNGPAYEEDGKTPSEKYCSLCYENGKFKNPDWKLEDILKFNRERLEKSKVPNFVINVLNRQIPKLERWKNQEEVNDEQRK